MSADDRDRWIFLVLREDLRQAQFADAPRRELQVGEVELRVQHFALSANNITYAFQANQTPYQYFPAPDSCGHVPVWGFASVSSSRVPNIAEGERFWGFLPMATHLMVAPEQVSQRGFLDSSAHRRWLPDVYNRYTRIEEELDEDLQMLFRPLFLTAHVLGQFLDQNNYFQAQSLLFSSASSKTALSIAHVVKHTRENIERVGFTSSRNAEFVKRFGCYDRVVAYEAIETLNNAVPTVFVDMAGDRELLQRVHRHFAVALKYSCRIGFTHWENTANVAEELSGPQPILFAAAAHIPEQSRDWGPGRPDARFEAVWSEFEQAAKGLIRVEHLAGQAAIKRTYDTVLEGHAPPDCGFILLPSVRN